MKDSTHQPSDKQSVVKTEKHEEIQQAEPNHVGVLPINAQLMPKIPREGADNIRQAAVLQMQRQQGNSFVQRLLNRGVEKVQRLPDEGALAPEPAPEDQGAGNTSIGDGSATVSAAGSTVEANAGNIKLNAPMTNVNGVLQADTIIANSVVASSYSPGAGNIW